MYSGRREAAHSSVWLAGAALATYLLMSKNVLFLLGLRYDTPGGSLVEKLHPGTYLAFAAFGALLLQDRCTLRLAPRVRAALPGAWLYLALIGACMAFQLATGGADRLVIYPESFLPAGLLGIVAALASPRAQRNLIWLLLGLFLLNIAVAVAEALQQRQWIPVYLSETELQANASEFRPTALYDHPLTAAAMTATGLFLSLAVPLRAAPRAMLLSAFALGLLAFGGRAAIIVSAALLAAWAGRSVLRQALARQIRADTTLFALLAAGIAAAAAVVLLAQTGIGGRLAGRLYWDDSAAARGVQWRMLALLDTGEWLAGASRARGELLVANLGLRYPFVAVENFWLVMFLDLGLGGFPLFVAAIAILLAGTARRVAAAARVLLLAGITIASASNSLGRKSALLTVLVPAAIATRGFARPVAAPCPVPCAAPMLRHAA